MGEGKPKFCLLFAFAFAFFATNANSQELLDPLLHPGARFMRENVEIETLAHWQGLIGVQFIGIGSQPTRQKILSEVFALASAARLDIEVFGFPNAMFEENAIAKASRVVFMEFDAELQPFIENGRGDQMALGEIDLSDANPEILSILDQGLVKQVDGCYSRWKASKENEIEGILSRHRHLYPKKHARNVFGVLFLRFSVYQHLFHNMMLQKLLERITVGKQLFLMIAASWRLHCQRLQLAVWTSAISDTCVRF